MLTTRRELFTRLAVGASLGAGHLVRARPATAQQVPDDLTGRIRADLVRHASFGEKFSGGPGDNATADWIAGRLEKSGYRLDVSTFDAPFFAGREARLTAGRASADVVPQAPVVPTGRNGVSGRLSLIEGGAATFDVRDRIALFVLPSGRHAALFPDRGIGQTVRQLAAGGARAIVMVTTGPSGEAVALNCPEEPFVPVPAAVLAPRHADPLVTAARAGAEATLVVDGDATHRPSKNLVARVERGDRWIVMSTPRSGWYGCVAERGTGTAALLELADWAVRRFPDLSIFLMNTGGHEYFFAGSHRVLDQAPPPEQTRVWAHIGATLAAREAAAQGFQGLSGLETPGRVRPGAGELSAFTDRGYSSAFAVIGVHRWFHTVEDTLDRVDAALVTPVVRAHQRTIERLATVS